MGRSKIQVQTCKSAKVNARVSSIGRGIDSGGRWQPQVAGGGQATETQGRPETGEAELKGGSRGEPDDWLGCTTAAAGRLKVGARFIVHS